MVFCLEIDVVGFSFDGRRTEGVDVIHVIARSSHARSRASLNLFFFLDSTAAFAFSFAAADRRLADLAWGRGGRRGAALLGSSGRIDADAELASDLSKANLGDFGVLETLFLGNGIPVDVRSVAGMLDDGEEEHGFRSRWLAFVRHVGLTLAMQECWLREELMADDESVRLAKVVVRKPGRACVKLKGKEEGVVKCSEASE